MEVQNNYTGYGREGKKYQEFKHLNTKEIAKLIRQDLKKKYDKNYKFSVRIEKYAGGSSINIDIKKCPISCFTKEYKEAKETQKWEDFREKRLEKYTEYGKKLMKDVEDISFQYNFSDCDGMIDYFDVNFYGRVNFDCDYIDGYC